MKRALFVSSFTLAIVFSLLAEDIAVPIHWQTHRRIKDYEYQVTGVGMYSDADKYVWALRISNLQDFVKTQNVLIGLYSDVDNNKATGRFPGKTGWDFQININLNQKTISVMNWADNKCIGMPLYIDDYLVETNGDMLYIAVRKEPIARVKFGSEPSMRIIGGGIGKTLAEVNQKIELEKTCGTFEPKFNFVRFGGTRQMFKKTSEALLIPRTDGLNVWNTFGERYTESEKMPQVTGKSTAIKTSAARGEAESAFFAVTADKPLVSLEVIPSMLKNSSGKEIAADKMVVKYIGFVGTLREEYFTDILSPVFMKSNSLNNFVALRVNTPYGIPAGIYKGTIKLKVNGKEAAPIPFEHEVYDFDMPDRPYFKTAYCIKSGYIKNYFKNISSAEYMSEDNAQCRLAKEFRFSPRLLLASPKRTWNNGRLSQDWTKFDTALNQYLNIDKFTVFQDSTFQLGSHGTPYKDVVENYMINKPEFDSRFGQLVGQTYSHYKQLGMLDKVFFVFWDEPYHTVYPEIRTAIEVAKKYAPGVQAGVFIGHIEPELEKHVDIWFSSFGTVAKLRANPSTKNKRVWTYNDVGVSEFVYPASVPRLYYWLAYKYNIEGYLYSEINIYNDNSDMKRKDIHYNKWVNHNWFYPGVKPGMTMPSLRMELTRDGIDDFDYITIWKQLAKSDKLPRFAEKAFPDMDIEGMMTFKVKTNREMQEIRDKLAREIVRLKNSK